MDFDWELRLLASFPVLEDLNKACKGFVLYCSQPTSEALLKRLAMGQNWVKNPVGGCIT